MFACLAWRIDADGFIDAQLCGAGAVSKCQNCRSGTSLLLHLDASCNDTVVSGKWQDSRESLRSTRYVVGQPKGIQDSESRFLVSLSGKGLFGPEALTSLLNFGREFTGFTISVVYKTLPSAEYGQTIIGVGHGGSSGTDWRLWVSGANSENKFNVEPWTMLFGTGRAGTDHWQPHFDMPCPNELVAMSASLSVDGLKLLYTNGIKVLETKCSMSDKGTGTDTPKFSIGVFSPFSTEDSPPPAHFAEVRVYDTAFTHAMHEQEQLELLAKWGIAQYSGSVKQARKTQASCRGLAPSAIPSIGAGRTSHTVSILCLLLSAVIC